MERITFRIPEDDIENLNKFVGPIYPTTSEAIRDAVGNLINKYTSK